MTPRQSIRALAAITLLCAIATISGCFVSKVPIGKVEDARVDLKFVGDWRFPNEGGAPTLIIVRNIDDKQYYVEWNDQNKTNRMVVFITEVNGVSFAQGRALTDDGSKAEGYNIVRVGLDNGKLALRQLEQKFFEGRNIETSDDLRKVVEANLENPEMYEKETALGTRAPADAKADADSPAL
jgi:hypothetical protein